MGAEEGQRHHAESVGRSLNSVLDDLGALAGHHERVNAEVRALRDEFGRVRVQLEELAAHGPALIMRLRRR